MDGCMVKWGRRDGSVAFRSFGVEIHSVLASFESPVIITVVNVYEAGGEWC